MQGSTIAPKVPSFEAVALHSLEGWPPDPDKQTPAERGQIKIKIEIGIEKEKKKKKKALVSYQSFGWRGLLANWCCLQWWLSNKSLIIQGKRNFRRWKQERGKEMKNTQCRSLGGNSLREINAKGISSIDSEGIEHIVRNTSENVRARGWEVVWRNEIATWICLCEAVRCRAIARSPTQKNRGVVVAPSRETGHSYGESINQSIENQTKRRKNSWKKYSREGKVVNWKVYPTVSGTAKILTV